MSFIYRDRNDDDYLIGEPWMFCFRNRKCGRVVRERYEEHEMTKKDADLENFYASGL